MAGYKGTGIIFLKNSIIKAGPEKEKEFLALLNEEEKKVWEKLLAFQWIPMEVANNFWIYSSKVLYPDISQDKAIYLLGIKMAKNDINKVYRLIFKFIHSDVIMQQASKLWRTYNQAGDCSVKVIESNRLSVYDVMNYPDLPKEMCQSVSGYIHGIMELSGRKNLAVVKQKHGTGWRWRVSYQ